MLVNMVRNEIPCFLSFYAVQGFITLGTAGEGIDVRFTGKGQENLLDLFLHEVAFDEQMVFGQRPITQGFIPCQDHAVLFER